MKWGCVAAEGRKPTSEITSETATAAAKHTLYISKSAAPAEELAPQHSGAWAGLSPSGRGQTCPGARGACSPQPCSCTQTVVRVLLRGGAALCPGRTQAGEGTGRRGTHVPGTHSAVLSPMWFAFLHCEWSGDSLWKPWAAASAAKGIRSEIENGFVTNEKPHGQKSVLCQGTWKGAGRW